MNRQTRRVIGFIAGVSLLSAGGWWLFQDSGSGLKAEQRSDLPLLFEAEAEVYSVPQDTELGPQAGLDQDEVTRIVIRDNVRGQEDDAVDIGAILAGKVVVGDRVVQGSGAFTVQ